MRSMYQKVCKPHIESILYEITLPLMMITDKEVQIWGDNQIEYVRLQVDNTNAWNVKRTNQDLVRKICDIRQTRKNLISSYLTGYLNVIV
jgi:hypothetical protein